MMEIEKHPNFRRFDLMIKEHTKIIAYKSLKRVRCSFELFEEKGRFGYIVRCFRGKEEKTSFRLSWSSEVLDEIEAFDFVRRSLIEYLKRALAKRLDLSIRFGERRPEDRVNRFEALE